MSLELLSPAGNFERMETAFRYGADAVYLGGGFSLRAFASFGSELSEAVAYAKSLDKKAYITVNILAHNADLGPLDEHLAYLKSINADGVIVSDLGVLSLAVKHGLRVHISTQASIMNTEAARVCCLLGAERIITAREMTLEEIKQLRDALPPEVKIEAFVHGAMCMAHSGRCLLSSCLTGRGANSGKCTQPCRWGYELRELSRSECLPVEQDSHGTYILNSRDLCMIDHISELIGAGVESFKIEGRMKTAYYVATVTNAYRRAIDDAVAGRPFDRELLSEVEQAANRGFTTGFYYGQDDMQNPSSSKCVQGSEFCAVVLEKRDGGLLLEQRNRFFAGDTLQVLSPDRGRHGGSFTVSEIYDTEGNPMSSAPNPQQHIFAVCKADAVPGDILRKPAR